MNTPWDTNFWTEKFSTWEELKLESPCSPKILNLYYFKSIDMTRLVNVLKEIGTYRLGSAHR